MAKTKYGKYIITRPAGEVPASPWSPAAPRVWVSDRAARVMFLDNEVLKGAFYVECVWIYKQSEGKGPPAHTHDFDEVIAFFGSNQKDPFDLGAEVEFWLGDEKHILTKSCVVFVPKGLKHCPLIFRRVDAPIFHFTTGPSSMYTGEKK